jgi:hypothetical protein
MTGCHTIISTRRRKLICNLNALKETSSYYSNMRSWRLQLIYFWLPKNVGPWWDPSVKNKFFVNNKRTLFRQYTSFFLCVCAWLCFCVKCCYALLVISFVCLHLVVVLNVGELRSAQCYKSAPVASGSLEWKFNVRVVIKSFIVGVLKRMFK